jgi:hypothetical protein
MIQHIVLLADQYIKEENVSRVPHLFDQHFQNQFMYQIVQFTIDLNN